MEPFLNLLAELQKYCDFAAICEAVGPATEAVGPASVVECQLRRVCICTCFDISSKLGLTNSRCFAHWQHKT